MFATVVRNVKRIPNIKASTIPFNLNAWMINWKALSSEVTRSQDAAKGSRMEKTIFERIINRELKADIIYEDEKCLAFNDVAPQAPTHFLVIPKRKIAMLSDTSENESDLLGTLLYRASALAKERLPDGFRVVINNGVQGCQSVYYLHVHVLGGRQMEWPPG